MNTPPEDQLDMSFLDSLFSGGGPELHPVDDFFTSYVDELARQSVKRHSESGASPNAKHVRTGGSTSGPLLPFPQPAVPSAPATDAAAFGAPTAPVAPGDNSSLASHQVPFGMAAGIPTNLSGMALSLPPAGANQGLISISQEQQLLQQLSQQPNLAAVGSGVPPFQALQQHQEQQGQGLAQEGGAAAAGTARPADSGAVPSLHLATGTMAFPGTAGAAAAAAGSAPALGTLDMLQSVGSGAASGSVAAADAGVAPAAEQPKRRMSKKKQESNKAAQQRYRERKKALVSDMEGKVEELTQQVARLRALEQRNALLEAQNSGLEIRLVEQEREIERLRTAFAGSASAVSEAAMAVAVAARTGGGEAAGGATLHASSAAGDDCDPANDVGPLSEGERRQAAAPAGTSGSANRLAGSASSTAAAVAAAAVACCEVLPQHMNGPELDALRQELPSQVERLKAFLEQHSVRQLPLKSQGVLATLPAPVVTELVQLVGRCCQLCQAATRADGVDVLNLIQNDAADLAGPGSPATAGRWGAVLRVLRLSAEQAQQLLLLRKAHLAKMRGIYSERQGLNMQAMALMLPQARQNPYDDGTAEGRRRGLSSSGYLAVARSSAELGEVLDKIKSNLRREQRAVMEMNCVTISRIMTPLQAAIYMVDTYPQHCDALALSNALVAEQSGKHEAGPAAGGLQATSEGAPAWRLLA